MDELLVVTAIATMARTVTAASVSIIRYLRRLFGAGVDAAGAVSLVVRVGVAGEGLAIVADASDGGGGAAARCSVHCAPSQ